MLLEIMLKRVQARTGAYIHYGDAPSFHEWEFRTRPCIAGKIW